MPSRSGNSLLFQADRSLNGISNAGGDVYSARAFSKGKNLVSPAQEGCAGCETRADGGEQNQVTFLQFLLFECCLHGKGYCAGGSVAKLLDVDDHFVQRHSEPFRSGRDDASIRLVRDEAIY